MKNILTALLLLLSMTFLCQNISDLDNKNGFIDFKLGDSYSKWSSQLKHLNTENNIKVYKYTGGCCNKLFGYNIQDIGLAFSNDQLVIINLKTDYFQKPYEISNEYTKWRSSDFEYINDSFIQLFGNPSDKNIEQMTFYWYGNKVILSSKYDYLGVRQGDLQTVTIISTEYLKNKKSKEF